MIARSVSKRFGPTVALDRFDLSVAAGEVVALMGANGAGKSTIVKILSGVYPGDGGSLELHGQPYAPASPQEAKALGVATMHQSIADTVVPTLSIADNLLLDRFNNAATPWFVTPAARLEEARAIAALVGLDIDLRAPLFTLPIATRQLVTLARALAVKPAVLILDEPTASLSAAEAERLFTALDRLRERGVAMLLVSHRLGDLKRMADRVVIVRDGRLVANLKTPIDFDDATETMIGRALPKARERKTVRSVANQGLQVQGLKLFAGTDSPALDFDAARGEIVAFAGPLGGGKSRLARTLFGIERVVAGTMTLDGQPWQPHSAAEAIRRGVFLAGEDRWSSSLFPDSVPFASIEGTLSFPYLSKWFKSGWINRSRERCEAASAIERFSIRCNGPADRMINLSGGNQQKVVLARSHAEPARMLLLDEPFQGVDAGARADIADVLRANAAGRVTLVFVSAIEEAYEVADRVLHFDRSIIETDIEDLAGA
ncbi:sugar ABC transporter ATP-binding protein [Burkholderia sp. S171]|uniref:sugar ABC transporter ATP-binding protein n=1 Tax=Burkholderia sp. S171 TaxID=1641860 RepID=UPI00131DF160|nr:sugar ABC transporter ATP-binding protein [Burkholderia sp. S171]